MTRRKSLEAARKDSGAGSADGNSNSSDASRSLLGPRADDDAKHASHRERLPSRPEINWDKLFETGELNVDDRPKLTKKRGDDKRGEGIATRRPSSKNKVKLNVKKENNAESVPVRLEVKKAVRAREEVQGRDASSKKINSLNADISPSAAVRNRNYKVAVATKLSWRPFFRLKCILFLTLHTA